MFSFMLEMHIIHIYVKWNRKEKKTSDIVNYKKWGGVVFAFFPRSLYDDDLWLKPRQMKL